ncbi:leukotriene B4 receptor 1 [Denticeps clupeoides]|uniref:leukotriene B4 receptor 1 n=1 Tax=Denticeps clupeoides TaxID=299321 RepID=UPI0010A441CF|nr:leukotriene B4 receptor 1-like [Denticeps clupeoides]
MQPLNISNSTQWMIRDQVSCVLLGICFVLGVSGNVMVVAFLLRGFQKKNFTTHLMLNLAASDILCLVSLPVFMYALLYGWVFSSTFCKLLTFVIYVSLYASVMSVTLMSVQRYLAVLRPAQWARLGRRGERGLLVTLWAAACILSGPAAATNDVIHPGGKPKCWRISMSDGSRAMVVLCETVFGFVVPFSILASSYFCLHKKVNQTAFFNSKRTTRLVTLIVATFFVLWIPIHILNLMDIAAIGIRPYNPGLYKDLSDMRRSSEEVVKSFTFINSFVNPFLYAFVTRDV